jgi:hypothetical protein
MQEHEQREHDRIPPELDPGYQHFDDERPPRTMRRRLQPVIWLVGAVTLVAMVLLVTPGL